MPVFSFLNAGVLISSDIQFSSPAIPGITCGLVLGKPAAMLGFIWLAHKLNSAHLPDAIRLAQMVGVCCLAGVAFSMLLFIAGLAYANASNCSGYRCNSRHLHIDIL